MPFEFKETKIKDVKIIEPEVFEDERGFFLETYVKEDFEEAGISTDFVQDNHSKSEYGVLRGLHFQKGEYSQAKLVRCAKGVIFDVAVDLRPESETFGEHIWFILSEHNRRQIYIPRDFAHGFLSLSETAEVVYKVDNDYAPNQEGGIIWDDPQLNIPWPIEKPKLSDQDMNWPKLKEWKRNQ